MTNILLRSCLALVCALFLTACEHPAEMAERPFIPTDQAAATHTFPTSFPSSVRASMDAEERRDLLLRNLDVFHGETEADRDWGHYLLSDAPLAEKDRHAQALLAQHPGPEWTVVQQLVAATLLNAHLKTERPDPIAVERYTRLLAENESPHADLIARALPHLKDRWNPAEVASVASTTQEAALDWIARTCSDCDAGQAIGVNTGPAATDPHLTAQRALPTLARFAADR